LWNLEDFSPTPSIVASDLRQEEEIKVLGIWQEMRMRPFVLLLSYSCHKGLKQLKYLCDMMVRGESMGKERKRAIE
jgi:hypothetical protein